MGNYSSRTTEQLIADRRARHAAQADRFEALTKRLVPRDLYGALGSEDVERCWDVFDGMGLDQREAALGYMDGLTQAGAR